MGVGYPDWRRQSDKDSMPELIADFGGTVYNGQKSEGPFYVGLWDYVAFRFQAPGTSAVSIRFDWFDDAALTHGLGTQEFAVSPQGSAVAQGRLLNLGPYLRILFTPNGAANWTMLREVFVSNRGGSHIFVPRQAWLVSSAPVVTVGTPVAIEFTGLAQGLMPILFSIGAQPGTFTLEVLTGMAPTWVAFYTLNLAASAFRYEQIPLPFGLVRVLMTNTGAANVVMNARGAWPAGAS